MIVYDKETVYSSYYTNWPHQKDHLNMFGFFNNHPCKRRNWHSLCEYMKDL